MKQRKPKNAWKCPQCGYYNSLTETKCITAGCTYKLEPVEPEVAKKLTKKRRFQAYMMLGIMVWFSFLATLSLISGNMLWFLLALAVALFSLVTAASILSVAASTKIYKVWSGYGFKCADCKTVFDSPVLTFAGLSVCPHCKSSYFHRVSLKKEASKQ